MIGHISASRLALYSRGDLGFWNRRQVEFHVERCDECAALVNEFVEAQEVLSESAIAVPAALEGVEWQALASEMTANIRLGLAAGECVAPNKIRVTRPRLAFALAGVAILLLIAGVERPRFGARPGSEAGTQPAALVAPLGSASADQASTLEASSAGIEVHSAGRVLAIPVQATSAQASMQLIRTVNTGGALRSGYVDDTGVTINNVYME